jgi:anti-anti-sigma regulatory factor
VKEFQEIWSSLAPSFRSKQVTIDLRGVTQMSADGRQILAEIYKQTNAKILADTPMTIYFAEEAKSWNKQD